MAERQRENRKTSTTKQVQKVDFSDVLSLGQALNFGGISFFRYHDSLH